MQTQRVRFRIRPAFPAFSAFTVRHSLFGRRSAFAVPWRQLKALLLNRPISQAPLGYSAEVVAKIRNGCSFHDR
jgi:hypothetical protein